MTNDEQILACKAIAKACMWGHGGIGHVTLDRLQETLPTEPSWKSVFDAHEKEAKREAVGVITDEDVLQRYLINGYWLTNYRPEESELALFNPPPMNGLHKYVLGALADKYGARLQNYTQRVAG